MKHILTVSRFDATIPHKLEELRLPINNRASRLRDLRTLFLELFKRDRPQLLVHHSATRFQEAYNVTVGEFSAALTILSYHERDNVPSLVRDFESMRQINALRTHLACFSPTASFERHERLFEFPQRAAVVAGERMAFQTDVDEGLWEIWYNDPMNRACANLQITHESVLKPKAAKSTSKGA